MTREEAIQILSTRDWSGMLCGYTSGYSEALDMAIEALQAEPTHGRLIDADALKEAMKIAVVKHICTNTLYNTIMAVIDGAPTVQADRPHGEWIEPQLIYTDAHKVTCTNCGERVVIVGETNFCPNCGCAMDKGENK